jgi:hypothetical protein
MEKIEDTNLIPSLYSNIVGYNRKYTSPSDHETNLKEVGEKLFGPNTFTSKKL